MKDINNTIAGLSGTIGVLQAVKTHFPMLEDLIETKLSACEEAIDILKEVECDGKRDQAKMQKSIIRLEVPAWQIGKEVSVYFPDSMVKHGICEEASLIQCRNCEYWESKY